MKSAAVAGILASVLFSQQAVANYGWNDAQSFSNPQNANNQCEGQQTGGWNFGDVPTGQVGSYDGFQFSGFSCQNGFNARSGKRGMKKRTQFDGKAIVGQATNDDSSCPKIAGQNKDFSITEMHVSTDKDAQLTFEFDMPDGSTCRQSQSCSSEGTVVKNSQCGGAKQVKVKGDCSFGFHSIIFDCQPGTTTSSSTTTSATTSSVPTTSFTTTPATTTTTAATTSLTCSIGSTMTGGSCVPTPPITTTTVPSTTTAQTTPATTPATTSICSEGSTTDDKGNCVPKTSSTTTTVCASTESKNDQGKCVPTGGITTPATTTPVTTTTSCGEGSTMDTTKSVCIPTGGSTTTPATSLPLTSTCSEGSTMDTSLSSCVKTPTGGPTTPVTTTAACAKTESLSGTVCVPTTTDVSATTSCRESSTMSGGACVPVVTPPPETSITTEIVITTVTSCPVTITSGSITSISTTLSTTVITSTTVVCNKCTGGGQPPVTTTPICKDSEELQNGVCVPKGPTGGSTAPTSTPQATTACSSGSTMNQRSSCVATPTGGITTPATSLPVSSTSSAISVCSSGSTMNDKSSCVATSTGGSTTPATSLPVSTTSSTATPATSLPVSTTSSATTSAPSCKADEEFKNGQCVKKPTGGLTTSTTTLSTSSSSQPPSTGTPIPEAGCPDVLPRCFSTWMQTAGSCSSNSDISCFCPSADFISSVQECVSAWGGSDANIQAALSYLAGICADFVPQNPGICTGVPSTITLVPQPTPAPSSPVTGGATTPAPTKPAEVPSTVITFTHSQTGSTVTQTVTVPQVSFNTITQHIPATGASSGAVATSTQGVGLVPAVPLTTPVGAPSSPAATPVAGQTGVSTFIPSTSTGIPASKTGNSPIGTFTGAANKPAFAVAAGLVGIAAFLV